MMKDYGVVEKPEGIMGKKMGARKSSAVRRVRLVWVVLPGG